MEFKKLHIKIPIRKLSLQLDQLVLHRNELLFQLNKFLLEFFKILEILSKRANFDDQQGLGLNYMYM